MEDVEKALPRSKFAKTANMLLRQLRTKEITLEEYLQSCAYWGMKTLGDIYFKSLPSRPMSVIEYEHLSSYKRDRLTQEFYADNPEITIYYNQKGWVETQNKSSLINLETIKKYIPESDPKSHEILDEKILDFKRLMEG